MIMTCDDLSIKSLNACQQVLARSGSPIVICNPDESKCQPDITMKIEVPKIIDCLQGLLNVIPLQLISSWLAVRQGFNVDFLINLAKSVTAVE
jgi:glucosamine--fructose-6-phosphate aminotransferase (isomerizing)